MAELATGVAKQPPAYERRLILFIDFLGFKEVVARTAKRKSELEGLIDALEAIGELRGLTSGDSRRVTQFSDSVVVSYRVNEASAVFWLVNAVALIVITLVERGYLLRGAVTIGKLLHTDRHIVGPAMVKAHEIESKVACHPRVIVDRKVLRAAAKHRQPGHSPVEEQGHVRNFLSQDEDGHLFIDYVGWKAVVETAGIADEAYPGYLQILSRIVRRGLKHVEPSVVRKYLWLHARYLATLNSIAASPKDSPHRLANPDYHDAIAGLPRYRKLAAKAAARIEGRDSGARARKKP